MAFGGAPPCCVGCGEFERTAGYCKLLATPTLDNRRQLLTMPCNVQRLLSQRFRSYGEDIAQDAMLVWLSPQWNPEDIMRSFGRAPRDARIWLTSWPYFYLGRTAIRRLFKERTDNSAEHPMAVEADPAFALRVARAFEKVHRVDPVSHAMLLDFLHDRFDVQHWCSLLSCSEATVTDRKYLGIYRYAAYFHEVLESVQPHEAAVALAMRRFAPGDPNDQAALEATRTTLSNTTLTMSGWRTHYREGALKSLELLSDEDALGRQTMTQLGTAFRRVLRVD